MAGPAVLLCDDAQGFRLMLGTLLRPRGMTPWRAAKESTRCVAGIGGISAIVSKRDRPEVIVAAVTDALPEPAHRRLVRPDDGTPSAEKSQNGRRASLERLRAVCEEKRAVSRSIETVARGMPTAFRIACVACDSCLTRLPITFLRAFRAAVRRSAPSPWRELHRKEMISP